MRTLTTLSLNEAELMADHAIASATDDKGGPIAVCIVGVDGNTIVAKTMDGCKPASIIVAANKAWTCARMGKSTIEYATRPDPIDPINVGDPRICFFPGGVAIVSRTDGQIIGAIGVSGRKAMRVKGDNYQFITDHDLARFAVKPMPGMKAMLPDD